MTGLYIWIIPIGAPRWQGMEKTAHGIDTLALSHTFFNQEMSTY